jgi:hypothetical protein
MLQGSVDYIAKMWSAASVRVSQHKSTQFMTSSARLRPSVYTCQSGITSHLNHIVILINWPAGNLDPPLFTNKVVRSPQNSTYCMHCFGSIQTAKVLNCLLYNNFIIPSLCVFNFSSRHPVPSFIEIGRIFFHPIGWTKGQTLSRDSEMIPSYSPKQKLSISSLVLLSSSSSSSISQGAGPLVGPSWSHPSTSLFRALPLLLISEIWFFAFCRYY